MVQERHIGYIQVIYNQRYRAVDEYSSVPNYSGEFAGVITTGEGRNF